VGLVSFTKVQRLGSHVIVAMVGGSSGGKTYSAILLGRGLVGPQGKLALLDTESGRGRIYSNIADYDYAELSSPFSPERYIEAIKDAEEAGYDALIIDSLSHEWNALGGVLEIADSGKTKDGRALTGLIKWAQPKARHGRFIQAILKSRMHLILCLRAKEKLKQVKIDGKEEIVSDGWVSVQDKNFIFEVTVQLFLPNNDPRRLGIPRLDKCPEDLLAAFPANERITVKTGELIAAWVKGGIPVDHALETLRHEAEEAADGGTTVLRAFWERMDKAQQKSLKPYMENLKSIAATADADLPVTFGPAEAETGDKIPEAAHGDE
jgi:hypothetical protein